MEKVKGELTLMGFLGFALSMALLWARAFPREPYDRYADPSPDPKREEHSREARERRVARDAKTVSEQTASADPAETGGFANRRAAPTHPSRAPTSSGGGDVRGPLAGEKSPGEKKSLFESGLAMPAMSMPSMSSAS